jgi:hypothetical protein
MTFFTELQKAMLKSYESIKTTNSHSNFEQNEESWRVQYIYIYIYMILRNTGEL